MNFTREPIIETVITPKDGCKLVVRNSKASTQDEYLVDALEVVTFGQASFYRSLEKPKCFLVPVGDYEVFEMRETRVVLKHVSHERSKNHSHKEKDFQPKDSNKEFAVRQPELIPIPEYNEVVALNNNESAISNSSAIDNVIVDAQDNDGKNDKKRDKRRQRRKRTVREVKAAPEEANGNKPARVSSESMEQVSQMLASLIPPPTTLVSELIGARYKDLIQANEQSLQDGTSAEGKERQTSEAVSELTEV